MGKRDKKIVQGRKSSYTPPPSTHGGGEQWALLVVGGFLGEVEEGRLPLSGGAVLVQSHHRVFAVQVQVGRVQATT